MKTGTIIAIVAIPVVAIGAFLLLKQRRPTGAAGGVNGIGATPNNFQAGVGLGKQPTPPPAKPPPPGASGPDAGAAIAVAGITALPGLVDSIGSLFG